MDDAIRIEDIKEYVRRRRAYHSTRRDAAETPADKGKIIGMLQALADFEGMIRQLRVSPVPATTSPTAFPNFHGSCDTLAAQWLSALALPGACLDDFRNDARQNKAIARYPEKREEIVLLGQLLRNKPLIDAVFDHLRVRSGQAPAPPRVVVGPGGACPYCGKNYRYAKARATHIAGCPKKTNT